MTVNIVLIDDSQSNLLNMESMIKEIECTVHVHILKASSAQEAIQVSNNKDIHLIVLNTNIKDMDSFEIAKKLQDKSKIPNVPIIFLTDEFKSEKFIQNGYVLGRIDYYITPIEKFQFLNKVGLYLRHYISKKDLIEYTKAIDDACIVSKADLKGDITFANDLFCAISGYSRDELIGAPYSILRSPNMSKDTFSDLWSTIQSKKTWNGVIENRSKNGSSYFVKSSITPILNYKNEIEEYISISEDFTALKKLQSEELSSSVDKALYINLQNTVDNIPIATAIIDKNSIIKFSNSKFKEVTNLKNEVPICSSFIEKEGYVFSDEIFDWKDFVINGDECKVLLNIYNEEKEFEIKIKELESQHLYTVCLYPAKCQG